MSVFRRLLRRGVATGGVAVLGLSVALTATSPALAEDPAVDLSVSVHSATASLDSSAKSVRVVVGNDVSAEATATNVTLRFKLPEDSEAGSMRVSDELAPSCELADDGRGGSCAIGSLEAGALANLNAFTLFTSGGEAGTLLGLATIEVVADQVDRDPRDNATVVEARIASEGGPDLATWAKRDLAVTPGEDGLIDDSVLAFSNESDRTIEGVAFTVIVPTELSFTTAPAGCEIQSLAFIVDCVWPDETIAGGEELSLGGAQALGFSVAADAPVDTRLRNQAWVAGQALGAADHVSITSSRPAEAGMTAFSTTEPGETQDDNWAEFAVFTHGDRADLSLSGNDLVAPINNKTELHLTVTNHGGAPARDHSVEAYVPAYAQMDDLPEACYVKGADPTRIQCDSLGLLEVGASVVYTIPVTMVDVPAESDEGRAQVTGSQPDPDTLNNFDVFDVTSIENRADLELGVEDTDGFPGDVVDVVFTVTNHGPATAADHQVLLTVPAHAEVAELPETCQAVGNGTVWCAVPTALNGGESATVTITVTILDAPDEQQAGLATVNTQSAADPDETNNTAAFLVNATENRADLAIAATEIDGKIGEEATGTLTVTNNGPAEVAIYHVVFTLPVHVELTAMPGGCESVSDDATVVLCPVGDPLGAGESRDIEFTVTLVDAPDEQLPGSAAVLSTQPDTDESNNSAQFTVHVQTEPGAPGEPGDPGDDDASGKLPTTGVSLTTAVGGAALIAALGLAALMVTRRRRRAATYGDL